MGPAFVVLLAPAVLGFAVGLLTGQTGADAGVVSAVLSAVVTGAGGAVLAARIGDVPGKWTSPHVLASSSVAMFSIFLIIGLHFGSYTKQTEEWNKILKERQILQQEVKFRFELLANCTRYEFLINSKRKEAGAELYSMEEFCPVLPQ